MERPWGCIESWDVRLNKALCCTFLQGHELRVSHWIWREINFDTVFIGKKQANTKLQFPLSSNETKILVCNGVHLKEVPVKLTHAGFERSLMLGFIKALNHIIPHCLHDKSHHMPLSWDNSTGLLTLYFWLGLNGFLSSLVQMLDWSMQHLDSQFWEKLLLVPYSLKSN